MMDRVGTYSDSAPVPVSPVFQAALARALPTERIVLDPLKRLAYGTDASFYRLTPEVVAVVNNEEEVSKVCQVAFETGTPVTFRAGGTSLSGQAVTDSVLVKLGYDGWRQFEILDQGRRIRTGPGLTGAQVNGLLAPYGRKIGPDPASISAAQIGGIAANNASGMCCGVSKNSYHTLSSLRLIMADGSLLDTGLPDSREAFHFSHGALLDSLSDLAQRTKANKDLAGRIRKKFSIKNTTGYSLNALIDFEDPFDILSHLIIGSEGTLAFISDITYETVPDPRDKATALVLFPDIETACVAVAALKQAPVDAVEIMDRAAIRSVEGKPGMPGDALNLPDNASLLLIEVRGTDADDLEANIAKTIAAIEVETLNTVEFTHDHVLQAQYWAIRKGVFPTVGSVREAGTTVIIEDVAVETPKLAEAVLDLQALFVKHGYSEASIFGHALEGNVHFVFTQGFDDQAEVMRYGRFMDDIADVIVNKYDGSLKAEHSTGRNMAPFVEMEWGADAAQLMRDIKRLFDPKGILNPGVIINDDPQVHLKNLKRMAPVDPQVDKCIECGFCEPTCPSRAFTTTPRQRIAALREISARHLDGRDATEFEAVLGADVIDSCAGDGLCAASCPVEINTGTMMKTLRGQNLGSLGRFVARFCANNFALVSALTRVGLMIGGWAEGLLGARLLNRLSTRINRMSGGRLPQWPLAMPSVTPPIAYPVSRPSADIRVVYFPSCGSRTMAPAGNDFDRATLPETMLSIFEKAGVDVVLPDDLEGQCCGMPFESKGAFDVADSMANQLADAIIAASRDGNDPVVFDTSPCAQRVLLACGDRIKPMDITEAFDKLLLNRLDIQPVAGEVLVHPTCSTRRMGLETNLRRVVEACGATPVIPNDIQCCGWAGDKGFFSPDLNASALRNLRFAASDDIVEGFSTSRTCEIGLSAHSGRPYRSIAYLVDRVSHRKINSSV